MELLHSIAVKLHDRVKAKFRQAIIDKGLDVPKSESSFWNIQHKGRSLFKETIGDFEPLFLRDKIKYKTNRVYQKSGKKILSFASSAPIENFLSYLGYDGSNISEKLNAFLESVEQEEKKFQQEFLIKSTSRSRDQIKPRDDIEELIQETAKLLSKRYSPRLVGGNFWLFFYGYDKFKGVSGHNQTTWPLVKLFMKFTDMVNFDIKVEIDNTGDPEHHDYIGKTDFTTSREEVLVINCRTYPDFLRQLNIKINIGKGDGDIFLGQYMNYESEGRIISGSLIIQRITDENIDLTPCVHRVPVLQPDKKMYTEDFEEVDKSILQYLHDKKLNFRRTSLRAGHSLSSLAKWLKYHHDK